MLRAVGQEFPVIGQLGRLALNPIVASATLLVGAFAIMRQKINDAADSFATAKWDTANINEAAKAWSEMAASAAKWGESTDGLAKRLKEISDYLALIGRLSKETAENPLFARRASEAKADAMDSSAAQAEAEAAQLRADAKATRPRGAEEKDDATQVTLDKDAAKAAIEIARLQEQIDNINHLYSPENRNDPRLIPQRIAAAARYGAFVNPEEMVGALEDQKAGYQKYIDLADSNRKRNETRDAKRKAADAMEARASVIEADAAKARADAKEERFRGQVAFIEGARAAGFDPVARPGAPGMSVTPEVKAYFEKANADLLQIAQEWAAAMEYMRRTAEQQNSRSNVAAQRQ